MTSTILTLTRAERIELLTLRDGPNCFHPDCGREFKEESDITFDHWIPQSRGGTWDIENLRMMHKSCNSKKGDLLPIDDVTLPEKPRRDPFRSRAVKRSERPELCPDCNNGRYLMPEESCNQCGSSPVPTRWPAYLHANYGDCDHSEFWCGLCSIGFVERKSVIQDLLGM